MSYICYNVMALKSLAFSKVPDLMGTIERDLAVP